jgi:hypothetical protein
MLLAGAECQNPSGGCEMNIIHVWELSTGQEIVQIVVDQTQLVSSLTFRADNDLLAAIISDEINIWTIPEGELLPYDLRSTSKLHELIFSPDGEKIYAVDRNTLLIWDTLNAENQYSIKMPWEIHNLTFNPVGDSLAVVAASGEARYFDANTFEEIDFPNEDSSATWMEWRGWRKGSVQPAFTSFFISFWNRLNGQRIKPSIGLKRSSIKSTVYAGDIQILVIGTSNGKLILWDTRPQSWIEQACRMANRILTPQEWDTYVGAETPYEPVCVQ